MNEAAERQCEQGGDTCGAMEPHQEEIMTGAVLCGGCGRRRAAAKYALVPADSEELITEEWLRECGFTFDDELGGWYIYRERDSVPLCYLDEGDEFVFEFGGLPFAGKTRGDVRRLCSALGIDLLDRKPVSDKIAGPGAETPDP